MKLASTEILAGLNAIDQTQPGGKKKLDEIGSQVFNSAISDGHDAIAAKFTQMYGFYGGFWRERLEMILEHLAAEKARTPASRLAEEVPVVAPSVSAETATRPHRREPTVFNAANFRKRREPLSY